MAKQRRTQKQAPARSNASSTASTDIAGGLAARERDTGQGNETEEETSLLEEAALGQEVGSGQANAAPGGGGGGAPGGDGGDEPLPYRAQLEQALGPLGDLSVIYDPAYLDSMNASAAQRDGTIVLRDRAQPLEVVAEEAIHAQQQSGGGSAGSGTTDPSGPVEEEAQGLAKKIASGEAAQADARQGEALQPQQSLPSGRTARHNKGAGDPVEPKTHDLGWFGKYEVYPDKFDLPKEPKNEGHTPINETAYKTRSQTKVEADKLKASITAVAAEVRNKPGTWSAKMNPILDQASGHAKAAIRKDSEWLTATFGGNPELMVKLGKACDPVPQLLQDLDMNGQEGYPYTDPLELLANWCKLYPGEAKASITDGRILDRFDMMGQVKRVKAVQLMLHGGEYPTDALSKMQTAILEHDDATFLPNFLEVCKDATKADELNNQNFIMDVEDNLTSSTLQMVKSTFENGVAGDANDMRTLNEDERSKAAPIIADGINKMHGELHAFWCKDSNVVGFVESMRSQLAQGVLGNYTADMKGKDDAGEFLVMAEKAKDLKTEVRVSYKQFFGTSLAADLANGMSGEELKHVQFMTGAYGKKGEDERELPAEDKDAEYTEEITEREQAEIDIAVRKYAGKIADEMDDFITDDDKVLSSFRACRGEVQKAVRPNDPKDPKQQVIWIGKVFAGMAKLEEIYNAQFGGLVDNLHEYVQDEGMRDECLSMIGNRSNANAGSANKAGATNMDADTAAEFTVRMTFFEQKIGQLAREFSEELNVGTFDYVSDSNVLKVCKRFEHARDREYKDLQNKKKFPQSTFNNTMATSMLKNAYRALAGGLPQAIALGLDKSNAETAFAKLELGSVESAMVPQSEDKAFSDPADQEARQKMIGALNDAFWAVERGGAGASEHFHTAMQSATGKKSNKELLEEVYKSDFGLSVYEHVGMNVTNSEYKQKISGSIGCLISSFVKPAEQSQEAVETDMSDAKFDPMKCSAGFHMKIAVDRAVELHSRLDVATKLMEAGQNPKAIHSDLDYHLVKLVGTGFAEENRLTEESYKKLYGVDIKYAFKTAFGKFDAAGAEKWDKRMETGGYEGDFSSEIMQKVQSKNLDRIYEMVEGADEAKRQDLLNDDQALTMIMKVFGDDAYQRVYRTLTGQLKLDDILRTRDEGTEWYCLFGIGTDEEGAEKDVKAFFERFLEDVETNYTKGPDGKYTADDQKAIDDATKKRARELINDPNVESILNDEFGGDELLKIRQIIASGTGEQTAVDKIETDIYGLGTGDDILAHLKELSDEERAKLREDDMFLQKLVGDCSGAELQQALQILNAKKGHEFEADMTAAQDSFWGNTDEKALMDSVLGMDDDELVTLANDPIKMAELQLAMDSSEDDFDRKLLKETLDKAKELGEAKPANEDGTMSQAEKDRQKGFLVLKHTQALKMANSRGAKDLGLEAQKVYKEAGEVEVDPATKAKEELFTAKERVLIRDAVMGDIRSTMTLYKQHPMIASSDYPPPDRELEVVEVVRKAIMKEADPSQFVLDEGFSGKNNDEAIDSALDNVSDDYMLEKWTNLLHPGVQDPVPLVKKWQTMLDYQGIYESKVNSEGAASETAIDARNDMLDAERTYKFHAIDVSATLEKDINQDSDLGIFDWSRTSDRERIRLKQKIRDRAIKLPKSKWGEIVDKSYSDKIAQIESYIAKGGEDPVAAQNLLIQQQNYQKKMSRDDKGNATGTEFLNNEIETSSQIAWAQEDYDHQRSQSSFMDAFSDDEYKSLDDDMVALNGEYAHAIEGDQEKGDSGTVTDEEKKGFDKRLDYFETSLTEYKAAKEALAKAMKWVAIAIITAVATALTGPGGPTLLMTMLTAAAQAGASVIIDEAVLGNDYDSMSEGIQKIVTETATAAITFGMGKGLDKVIAASPKLTWVNNLGKRWSAFEGNLQAGAGESIEGFAGYMLASGGKAVFDTGVGAVKEMAVNSVDLSEWKYGMTQGMTHTESTVSTKMDALPGEASEAFLWAMYESGTGVVKDKVMDKWFPDGQSGVENLDGQPTNQDQKKKDDPFTKALNDTFKGENLVDKGLDAGLEFVSDKLKTGNAFKASGWSEEELGEFVASFAKARFKDVLNGTAKNYQSERNKELMAAQSEKLLQQFSDFQKGIPAEMSAGAKAHFEEFMASGWKGDPAKALEQWKEEWAVIERQLDNRMKGASDEERKNYMDWVLGDPKKLDERLVYSATDHAEKFKEAQEEIDQIMTSKAYDSLTVEQRAFYNAYLSDANDFVGAGIKTTSGGMVDVRIPEQKKEFLKQVDKTKTDMFVNQGSYWWKDWSDEKKKKYKQCVADDLKGGALPEILPENFQGTLDFYINRFSIAYDDGDIG